MIFVVGGGRGEGGLSPNDAVIHVNAPVGSTITFSKGGVVTNVLGPEKSHVNAANSEVADYYYPVTSSNYGAWTVAGTLGNQSASQTVTVDANKQYDVGIIYFLYLYKNGVSNTAIIGSWNQQKYYCNVSFAADRITFSQTDSQGHAAIYTNNKISLANRTTLCVDATPGTTGSNFGLTNAIGNWNPTYVTKFQYSATGRQTQRLNISGYSSGSYHVVLNMFNGGQIYQVWFE